MFCNSVDQNETFVFLWFCPYITVFVIINRILITNGYCDRIIMLGLTNSLVMPNSNQAYYCSLRKFMYTFHWLRLCISVCNGTFVVRGTCVLIVKKETKVLAWLLWNVSKVTWSRISFFDIMNMWYMPWIYMSFMISCI